MLRSPVPLPRPRSRRAPRLGWLAFAFPETKHTETKKEVELGSSRRRSAWPAASVV